MKKVNYWINPDEDLNEIKEIGCFTTEYEDALIKELIDNRYIICGDTHQYKCLPVFDDGYLMLSMRKWGEIMSKAYNLIRGGNFTSYVDFYLLSLCNYQENLPKIKK